MAVDTELDFNLFNNLMKETTLYYGPQVLEKFRKYFFSKSAHIENLKMFCIENIMLRYFKDKKFVNHLVRKQFNNKYCFITAMRGIRGGKRGKIIKNSFLLPLVLLHCV